jgi:hypothetical protein
MVVWSKDFIEAEVLPLPKSPDAGFASAILRFKTSAAAEEAQHMLNGKPNFKNDAEMIVEIFPSSPSSSRRYLAEGTNGPFGANGTSVASSASSIGPAGRQSSRFNDTFQTMERISPTNTTGYTSSELPNPESSAHYQSLFSPQSPIGNHLTTERSRVSGKALIKNDTAEDDETGELLKDPIAYVENGSAAQQRRATIPQLPIGRMASLSLNTNPTTVNPVMSTYGALPQSGTMQPMSATFSPTAMTNGGPPMPYAYGNQHFSRHSFPPVNPADQNPPCNTLYVGNLPIDTSEDELKAMFSKQRGYKRLCFRTKQNGPMCFVEFEDVSFATKALHELYGHPLHNSVKGGIRLSFSKNPLGVRSGQAPGVQGANVPPGAAPTMNGMMNGMPGAGFSTVNGPPPGLTAPPGLGPSRVQYGAINPMANTVNGQYGPVYTTNAAAWGVPPAFNGPMNGSIGQGGAPNGVNGATGANGTNSGFPSAYMRQ